MRFAWVLLLCLATAVPARADDPSPADRVGGGWIVERETPFEGEAFSLRLLLMLDHDWFEAHAVPLFAQDLDLPLEIEVPAFRSLPGVEAVGPLIVHEGGATVRVRVALNGERVEVGSTLMLEDLSQPKDTRKLMRYLRLERRCVAPKAGSYVLVGPTVRFVHASGFTEDALGGRVPLDRKEHSVQGEPLTIQVAPLPTRGRPVSFGGAIGRFTLSAVADRREVKVGETFRLTVTIEGDGNQERFEAPRPDPGSGFHVYGTTDDRAFPRRTIVYDLAAQRADLTSVPAIVLPYFDPKAAAYRIASSTPLPLTVHPKPGGAPPAAGSGAPAGDGKADGSSGHVAGGTVVVVLIVLFAVMRRRARRRPATTELDAVQGRFHLGVARLRTLADEPTADLSEPFAEVVAARLGQPRAAAIAPDLAARLTAVGVTVEDAREAAQVMEVLVAARYGGTAPDAARRDRIFTLASRLAEVHARRA